MKSSASHSFHTHRCPAEVLSPSPFGHPPRPLADGRQQQSSDTIILTYISVVYSPFRVKASLQETLKLNCEFPSPFNSEQKLGRLWRQPAVQTVSCGVSLSSSALHFPSWFTRSFSEGYTGLILLEFCVHERAFYRFSLDAPLNEQGQEIQQRANLNFKGNKIISDLFYSLFCYKLKTSNLVVCEPRFMRLCG